MTTYLNIGITGLRAAQIGLATTQHNIANVNTVGFSRQEIFARIERLLDDQERPAVPQHGQGPGDRTGLVGEIVESHGPSLPS